MLKGSQCSERDVDDAFFPSSSDDAEYEDEDTDEDDGQRGMLAHLGKMYLAAACGRVDKILRLVRQGVAVTAFGNPTSGKGGGDTLPDTLKRSWPLHIAARNGHAHAVVALLHAKAPMNTRRGDRSPLTEAISGHHLGVIKYMLRYGETTSAGAREPTSGGYIHDRLSDDQHGARETTSGGDIHDSLSNQHDIRWASVWSIELREALQFTVRTQAGALNGVDVVKMLLAHKADTSVEAGDTPLLCSVADSGDIDVGRELLASGALDVDAVDADGMSPLHVAAAAGNYSVLKWLIDTACCSLHMRMLESRRTCLHIAADHGCEAAVSAILQACRRQHRAYISMLLMVHARCTASAATAASSAAGWIPRDCWLHVTSMLCTHPLVDAEARDGVTALTVAAGAMHPGIVKLLLDARADPRHRDALGKPLNTSVEQAFVRCTTDDEAGALASRASDVILCHKHFAHAVARRAAVVSHPTALLVWPTKQRSASER